MRSFISLCLALRIPQISWWCEIPEIPVLLQGLTTGRDCKAFLASSVVRGFRLQMQRGYWRQRRSWRPSCPPGFEYEGTLVFFEAPTPQAKDFSGGLSGGEISWLLPGRAEEVGCQSRGTKEHTEGASDCTESLESPWFYDVFCGTTMLCNEIPCVMPRRWKKQTPKGCWLLLPHQRHMPRAPLSSWLNKFFNQILLHREMGLSARSTGFVTDCGSIWRVGTSRPVHTVNAAHNDQE